jgi:hypothetical protein
MSKIIYLIEQPLDERNFNRFGIQKWIDRNWEVEVWDLTPRVQPRVWRNFLESGRKLKVFAGYFPIASHRDLRKRYCECGQAEYFIDLTGDTFHSIWVKARLAKKGISRIICLAGSIPIANDNGRHNLSLKLRRIAEKGIGQVIYLLCLAFTRRLMEPFIRPGLVIASGESSVIAAGQCRERLNAHSFDYDIYLTLARLAVSATQQYVVFIDQDVCFHSDFIYQKIPCFMTPEKYFPTICNGLRRIAGALNVGVQIAAHPRATYGSRGHDYFEGYPIEYGKTAELIRDSRIVVCHNSTAIHLAVLFEKPLILVTTDQLINSYEGRLIDQAAEQLGKSVINLDGDLQSVTWHEELKVDQKKYVEYKNRYIKMNGSPERPMWEIVVDYVEEGRDAAGRARVC